MKSLSEADILNILNEIRLETAKLQENNNSNEKDKDFKEPNTPHDKTKIDTIKDKVKTQKSPKSKKPATQNQKNDPKEQDEGARPTARTRKGSLDYYMNKNSRTDSGSGSRKRSNRSPLQKEKAKDIKLK